MTNKLLLAKGALHPHAALPASRITWQATELQPGQANKDKVKCCALLTALLLSPVS